MLWDPINEVLICVMVVGENWIASWLGFIGYVTNFRVINKEMFGDTIMKFKFNSIMFIMFTQFQFKLYYIV